MLRRDHANQRESWARREGQNNVSASVDEGLHDQNVMIYLTGPCTMYINQEIKPFAISHVRSNEPLQH